MKHTHILHISRYLWMILLGMIPLGAFAQTYTVKGRVIDQVTKEPLIGVNIVEVGRTDGRPNGAVSDLEGNFTLQPERPDSRLLVSYIGYAEKEVSINGQSFLTIELHTDNLNLDEVVVVGYGTVRKSDLTGSVSVLKNSELTKISSAQPTAALQGKIPGLTVLQGGAPGAAPMIKVRGVGTTNNSDPLFVVDGVLVDDALFVNSEDIESMQVLKDASATAIYGSRGANGVIIITTKKGAPGKARIQFSGYEGFQKAQRDHLKMTNASEFATLYNEAMENSGFTSGLFENPESLGKGTDWLGEILRTAPVRNYSVSASGGTDKVTYNASFSYFKQDGVQKKSDYERFTFRLNNLYKFNSYVELGHNLTYNISSSAPALGGAIQTAYRSDPTANVYDEEGNYADTGHSSQQNVVANMEYHNQKVVQNRFVGDIYLQARFLKDFTVKTSVGFDVNNTYDRYFRPEFFISNLHFQNFNELSKNWYRYYSWLWENTISYDKQIGKDHRINAVAGFTMQEFNDESLGGYGRNVPNQELTEMWYLNNIDKTSAVIGNGAWSSSMLSYLFRANYAYKDRYLATVTFRADGSSKFGPDSRWGYFPSFALAWRVKEEAFLREVEALSNLKVRMSWGQIGNDKIGNYRYHPLVYRVPENCDYVIGGVHQQGATIVDVSNKDLHWEKTTQFDVGFDLGLLNNRLNLEFDYYNRVTSDMLVTPPVPGFVGASTVEANVGKVRNRGFDLSLNWQDQLASGFRYGVSVVGSSFKNKVLDLAGRDFYGGGLAGGKTATLTREGMAMSTFYGYKVIGVYQNWQEIEYYNNLDGDPTTPYNSMYHVEPGDLIFADITGEGRITTEDKTDLGSPFPKFTGSLGIQMEWKGFDFSLDLYGSYGNKIYNAKRASRSASVDNFDRAFLKRWTGEGTSNKEPRLTFEGNNWEVSERFIEDGSFCKIQSVVLGYTLPVSFTRKFHVEKLRFYIAGNDLKYFTKYNGFTPEIGGNAITMGVDDSFYPVAATYKFGVNINF